MGPCALFSPIPLQISTVFRAGRSMLAAGLKVGRNGSVRVTSEWRLAADARADRRPRLSHESGAPASAQAWRRPFEVNGRAAKILLSGGHKRRRGSYLQSSRARLM